MMAKNTCRLAAVILYLLSYAMAVDDVDQNKVFDAILNNTDYDLRRRPDPVVGDGLGGWEVAKGPVVVTTSVYMYFLGHIDDERLEFETVLNIRHRWVDTRLAHSNAGNLSYDQDEIKVLEGESWFSERIWTPNIFIENEQSSSHTGLLRDNQFVRIEKNGTVQFNYRVTSTVLCNMVLHRFPHDRQYCSVILESWTLSTDDMILTWSDRNPLQINEYIMPEYKLDLPENPTTDMSSCYAGSAAKSTKRNRKIPTCDEDDPGRNYSSLVVNFELRREIAYYIIDYYIPSMLLVAMSWVSFWLHPNAVPGRTTLGTSTWLTFITLTHNTGSSNLPKVNYIKFLDIWFLVCTLFIIASLLEFAFVNNISRRTSPKTKKLTSNTSVLPAVASLFSTPEISPLPKKSISRRNSRIYDSHDHLSIASSFDTLQMNGKLGNRNRRSTVASFDSLLTTENDHNHHLSEPMNATPSIPSILLPNGTEITFTANPQQQPEQQQQQQQNQDLERQISTKSKKKKPGKLSIFCVHCLVCFGCRKHVHKEKKVVIESMVAIDKDVELNHEIEEEEEDGIVYTSEELALWVDVKARVFFPCLFLFFNFLYWFFAGRADCKLFYDCYS